MNQLESAYAMHLAADRDIAWFAYEGVTLKLAHDTRYTPDFAVMLRDGTLEMRECKGPHAFEDSLVKLKCAAAVFPFIFRLVTRSKDGAWESREVGAPRKNVPARSEEMPARKQTLLRRVEAGANAARFERQHAKAVAEINRGMAEVREQTALLNGKPISRAEALEMIRK